MTVMWQSVLSIRSIFRKGCYVVYYPALTTVFSIEELDELNE